MKIENYKIENSLRCGLIGLGKFGKNYLHLLQEIDGVTLRAVANRESEAFETYKNLLQGIKTTLNADDIFSDPEIDAVFIVTPPKTHYALIEKGLMSGKHVFVEKPMVLNISEAQKLKKIVGGSGKIFMVGYQYIFNENIRFLKTEIGKGTFGKIISVTHKHAVSPPRLDVDIFMDDAPHPLSVFQYLFNPLKLSSVEGKIENDNASLNIRFENAPLLKFDASWFGQIKIREMTIVGEKATAILDETLDKNKLAILKNGKTSYPEIIIKEPLRSEIEHFVQCIQTGSKPLTDIDFGSQITEWLETISRKCSGN
jgi:predicted dehydrogenase